MIRCLRSMSTSQRDGLILIACLGLLLLADQVLWRPWAVSLAAGEEKLAGMHVDLAGISRQADKLRAVSSRENKGEDLLVQVNMLASQYGIQLEAARPLGDARVNIGFSAAEPAVLWPWLAELEKRGLIFEQLGLLPAGRTSAVSGKITVTQGVR